MPGLPITRWVWIMAMGFAALGTPGRPIDMPAELMPRADLEKLYAAQIPGYARADYNKLYEAQGWVEKFMRTDSAEDRRAITGMLEKSGLGVATIGELCRINLGWAPLPPGPAYVNERIGVHEVQYFLGVPAGYDRTKSWPLVIRLISADALIADPANPPKADEVVRLYTRFMNDELTAHPDALVIMPLLNLDEFYGPSLKGMNTVVQAMHHVATRANVDASRVYLLGHGMGAHAVWNLALHYPTYFAAINPQAGAASADWQRVRMLNLRNTLPIVWADQTDKIIKPDSSTALVAILRNLKYDVVLEVTRTLGHTPSPEIVNKQYALMRARQREVYPQQVNLRSTRLDPTFNRVDWVQVYQPINSGEEKSYALRKGTGRINVCDNAWSIQAAFTKSNRIEARSDNVQTLRFYLSQTQVDFSKPLTVVVNGKTRFEGMVTPSVEELLRDQLVLGRGWRSYAGVVEIDLAPRAAATKPSTMPSTGPATRAVATPASASAVYFFSLDDGKTLFKEAAAKRPPFMQGDKAAVRAHAYTCDGKGRFVAYLEKWSPIVEEMLVKRPGETRWVQISSAAAAAIMAVKCPEGMAGQTPVEIFPGSGD